MSSQKALWIAGNQFIGHFSLPAGLGRFRPSTVRHGLLIFNFDALTYVWPTGEIQSLKLEVDDGKFIHVDDKFMLGEKLLGEKLLIYAVTNWTKGWAVYEAKLTDFDINVARQAMSVAANFDKQTTARFIVQVDGTVRDLETGLNWTQSSTGVHSNNSDASGTCRTKGKNWDTPSSKQLRGIFLATGSVRALCGGVHCYISPTFKLSAPYVWSRDFDDYGNPLMINLATGDFQVKRYPDATTATALCVRSN